MPETPEQRARREIDASLTAAGWLVQDRPDIDLTAGRGIAVRELPMKPGFGFADYLLYLDRKAIGAVEAKAEGTLTGVEAQSAKYAAGLPDNLPAHARPLPFLFESNGAVTYFTNGRDPVPRSRQVFNFPRPETLAEWIAEPVTLRARLRTLPEIDASRLCHDEARPRHCQRASRRRHAEGDSGLDSATGRPEGAAMKKMQYLVRINKDPGSDWGASVPDLPGCVATGKTIDSTLRRIGQAIELHLRGMREDGLKIPAPRHRAVKPRQTARQVDFYATVEVAA